jgi:mono/diheme cytochrome c family protein
MQLKTFAIAVLLTAPFAVQAEDFDLKASITRGQPVYMQTCFACHQMTGLGLPGAFPPLAGSEYVSGNPRRMVAMMLKGLQGPLTVKGVTYNNVMLALDMQFPILKEDAKVADVVNYVRNSFGNTATEAVTPALVAEVRAKWASRTAPFTEADVKEWKEDAAPATAGVASAANPASAAEPAK